MPTYAPADLITKPLPSADGCGVVYHGKATATSAAQTGDIVRFCVIPAGTELTDVLVKTTTAFGTTAPCTIRLASIDGSSDAVIGASGATATLVGAGSTALQTVGNTVQPVTPVQVKSDCFLECLLGTVGTGAQGVATVTAYGMAYGAR
jgi:hypothetical protein